MAFVAAVGEDGFDVEVEVDLVWERGGELMIDSNTFFAGHYKLANKYKGTYSGQGDKPEGSSHLITISAS
jgi:hypothetical protein